MKDVHAMSSKPELLNLDLDVSIDGMRHLADKKEITTMYRTNSGDLCGYLIDRMEIQRRLDETAYFLYR